MPHSHSHGSPPASNAVKKAAVAEFISTFLTGTLWNAGAIDNLYTVISNSKEIGSILLPIVYDTVNYSAVGIFSGLVFAGLVAWGTAKSHYHLNIQGEGKADSCHKNHDYVDLENPQSTENTPLINEPGLDWVKKLALLCDQWGHAMDYTGALANYTDLFFRLSLDASGLSLRSQAAISLAVKAGFSMWGYDASEANRTTCESAMKHSH